jgi:PPP family 3-phenylpropionic acid transporter
VFSLFIFMPSNASFAFLPYLVDSVGGNTAQLGLVSGYKALLEIPMLLIMKPLRRRFPLPVALIGAGVFYAIESMLYFRVGSLTGILLIQTLTGLGGGLIIGAGANYVFLLAPEGLSSTAQSVSGTVSAVAAIFGNLAGGYLISAIGIKSFYLIVSGALVVAVVYFVATLIIGVKIFHKPIPHVR